ncbi:MAG: sigma-70 family RNA polymerase sigma factor [Chitinophagaceae bacterium]|nr:sigma-70 family RNA polymerase sigma factor [Chitinophagaceae bacterium]
MSDFSPDNEPVLVKRISDGDAEAFSQIFHQYNKTVYHTVMTYVKDVPEAEEIVQQIFVKLWENRSSLAGVRSFRDYFFIATRNSVFSYFNRLARHSRLMKHVRSGQTEIVDDTDHLVLQRQYDALVGQAIEQLPPQQKQVYLLTERDALNYDQIAANMQISRSTVKKHMELARKAVRSYIYLRLKDDIQLLALPAFVLGFFKD